jgi:hypothetical protein
VVEADSDVLKESWNEIGKEQVAVAAVAEGQSSMRDGMTEPLVGQAQVAMVVGEAVG